MKLASSSTYFSLRIINKSETHIVPGTLCYFRTIINNKEENDEQDYDASR